jgi:hypothetical protein
LTDRLDVLPVGGQSPLALRLLDRYACL